MTYSTSNPPQLLSQGIGFATGLRVWAYASADASTVVDGDAYFSNGDALGMKAGDLVLVNDTDTNLTTMHVVLSVASGGAADLGDGTTVGDSTDSD
jgi:hypothetical protein